MGALDFDFRRKLSFAAAFDICSKAGTRKEGKGILLMDVSLFGGVTNNMDLLFPFSCSMDNR